MNDLFERYAHHDMGMVLDSGGPFVMFRDVEEALRDREKLQWLLPVIEGTATDPAADQRTAALVAGIALGLNGRTLVQFAMEGCPV